MSKKKILYFFQIPPPKHGVSLINQRIIENDIINKSFESDLLKIDFSTKHSSLNKLSVQKLFKFFSLSLKLFIKLRSNNYDAIYFTLTPSGPGFLRDLFFIFIINLFKIKKILHLHGIGIAHSVKRYAFAKHFYNFAFKNSVIIHLSKNLLNDEITSVFKDIKYKAFFLNNSTDRPRKQISKERINEILFLSNLFPSKGIHDVLEIFYKLSLRYPYLKMNIAGAESSKETTKKITYQIETYSLQDKVKIFGFANEELKNDLFTRSDLFLYPTRNDAFPLVLLEAISHGLPIVASDIGAINEIVLNEKTGFVLKHNNDDFEKRIIDLIEDQAKFKFYSNNAISHYNKNFTSNIFDSKLSAILKKELNI